ncbi:SGNH hydrolase [Rhizodiscina lignyota]|uniref:SGNH hydrolase n=1 Tax=Rhizodiscina lignyota TaxID=1504668 RepID=A0A9P4M425_9PEZI|nr:SGNH hydrolase [Rhizodiscina lignyota]
MISFTLPSLLCLILLLAGPANSSPTPAMPTVYLAGDSTMAKGIQRWGVFLQYSLNIPVINAAISGRSARSYTNEGRFQEIADVVKPGDWVIIEFGHNDGGSLVPVDNGRTDCPGDGAETCYTVYDGKPEVAYSFNYYIETAGMMFMAKGANVIISSQTPNNDHASGYFRYTPSPFVWYSKESADSIRATFVDHGLYTGHAYHLLGKTTVESCYQIDNVHTSSEGADYVAAAFVKALLCGHGGLKQHVKNSTAEVYGDCI